MLMIGQFIPNINIVLKFRSVHTSFSTTVISRITHNRNYISLDDIQAIYIHLEICLTVNLIGVEPIELCEMENQFHA